MSYKNKLESIIENQEQDKDNLKSILSRTFGKKKSKPAEQTSNSTMNKYFNKNLYESNNDNDDNFDMSLYKDEEKNDNYDEFEDTIAKKLQELSFNKKLNENTKKEEVKNKEENINLEKSNNDKKESNINLLNELDKDEKKENNLTDVKVSQASSFDDFFEDINEEPNYQENKTNINNNNENDIYNFNDSDEHKYKKEMLEKPNYDVKKY